MQYCHSNLHVFLLIGACARYFVCLSLHCKNKMVALTSYGYLSCIFNTKKGPCLTSIYRSLISDRRFAEVLQVIRSYNYSNLEVQLHYNPLSAGAIEILRLQLHLKHF